MKRRHCFAPGRPWYTQERSLSAVCEPGGARLVPLLQDIGRYHLLAERLRERFSDAGLRAARGAVLGLMDGDGQNDPRDFPRLTAALATCTARAANIIEDKTSDAEIDRIPADGLRRVPDRWLREAP